MLNRAPFKGGTISKKGTIDDEIEREFATNPELYKRSPNGIAKYMYIQAELRFSLLRETMKNKATFYRMRLYDLDPELCKALDKEWNEVASLEVISETD